MHKRVGALLRAELGAYYGYLYGLTRDELRYILDPQEVMGEEWPSKTFRVLKEREVKEHGEYRTRRLVLEAFDRFHADGTFDPARFSDPHYFDTVKTVLATTKTQHRVAADRVLGLASPRSADAEPHPSVTQDGSVNTDQFHAVRRSLGSDTTFVLGPPGTGKTTTLARIVEAHYRAGRSVLLVSNTNIAVDTALERVAERLKGEPDFHQGLVVRQGPVLKEELRQRFGQQVILEEIMSRVGAALRSEKEQLAREGMQLAAHEQALLRALADVERLAQARQALDDHEKKRATAKSAIALREREVEQHRANAAKLRSDLQRAQAMGAVRRFFWGLKPERLERDAATADRSAQAAAEAARALAADLPKIEGEIATTRSAVDRLVEVTRAHPQAGEAQARLGTVRARIGQIRERIAAIERELAEVEQQVLARCRILATTVYRTYLGKGAPRQFDVVVVDEASMLMPPLVFYAAGLATQSVTVAGDFRQLAPIVMSDEPLAEEWLKRDVFENAGIPLRLQRREPVPSLVALGTQYRMREPICAIINDLFYADRPLVSAPGVSQTGTRFPLASAPLLYVDTAPFHPWTAMRVGTYSRYNLFHALLFASNWRVPAMSRIARFTLRLTIRRTRGPDLPA